MYLRQEVIRQEMWERVEKGHDSMYQTEKPNREQITAKGFCRKARISQNRKLKKEKSKFRSDNRKM